MKAHIRPAGVIQDNSNGARRAPDPGAVTGQLRRPRREEGPPEPLLILPRDRVQLNRAADLGLEAAEFWAPLAAGDRHVHTSAEPCPECAAGLERAARLYQGDFLAGFSAGDGAG